MTEHDPGCYYKCMTVSYLRYGMRTRLKLYIASSKSCQTCNRISELYLKLIQKYGVPDYVVEILYMYPGNPRYERIVNELRLPRP